MLPSAKGTAQLGAQAGHREQWSILKKSTAEAKQLGNWVIG